MRKNAAGAASGGVEREIGVSGLDGVVVVTEMVGPLDPYHVGLARTRTRCNPF